MMLLAIDASNHIVLPHAALSGLASQCRCVECNKPVIAITGEQAFQYFIHACDRGSCDIQTESFIYRYAKQVIAKNKGLTLPPLPSNSRMQEKPAIHLFDSMLEEVYVSGIKPDILALKGEQPLMIELSYSDFVDDERKAAIRALGIPTVEIDLSKTKPAATAQSLINLRRVILTNLAIKRWIYPFQQPI